MPKIDVTMNSVYDSGKIRGYATAVLDDSISIRGIKIEKEGVDLQDEFDHLEVEITMPKRENNLIFNLLDQSLQYQLKSEVYYAYCTAVGVDMTVADPIERASTNTKNLDVLITKLSNNPDSTLKALASVNIDEGFSIDRVEVRTIDGVLDVQMPQRKTVDGYKEICSLTNQNYEKQFKEAVLEGYFHRLELIDATLIQQENQTPLLESGSETQEEVENQEETQEESQNQEENQEEQEEETQNLEEMEEELAMGGMESGQQ